MAVPQYCDEVLVTLTSLDPPESFAFPDRRIFLTKEKPVMDIGRTSKRNASFEATKNNAWFDSPVMSRDHAHLRLDVEKQKVYIKDIGSLHGTFKNGQRLSRNVASSLASGDLIRFGIPIDRGSDRYPPCSMEARIKFGTSSPEDRPKVFRVPDDSDVEDSGSDDDHSIRNSSEILRNAQIHPASFPSSSPRQSPIDLTSNDQYPLSNVRGDDDYTSNALPPVSSSAKTSQEVTYVDLSSPSPEETVEYNGFSPISPGAGWPMGEEVEEVEEVEEIEEGEINLSDSTDMDTESSVEDSSPSQSPSPASLPSGTPIHYSDEDALDVEEDEFEELDEFEDKDCASEPLEDFTSRATEDGSGHFPVQEMATQTVNEAAQHLSQNTHETQSCTEVIMPPEVTHQDAPENSNNPLGAGNYMLHTQLPPIEQPKMTLPPWVQPCYVQPLRLPPISEAMPHYPPTHSNDSKAMAEMMGAKTGKYEFFAARAENKLNARLSGVVMCENPISVNFPKPSDQEPVATESMPQEPHAVLAQSEIPPANPTTETAPQNEPSKRLVLSDWTASGVQFLNSPPEETQDPQPNDTPVLDETSAYQFELSKKASGNQVSSTAPDSQAESTKRTHMEISDILETSNETSNEIENQQSPSGATKRKASAISKLTPPERIEQRKMQMAAERRIRSVTIQRRLRQTLMKNKMTSATTASDPTQVADSTVDSTVDSPVGSAMDSSVDSAVQRPSKRLRRVAEVFGYAALGGVAVMSALIATAPTL